MRLPVKHRMNKGTVGINSGIINDQSTNKTGSKRLSLKDSGLMHIFNELDIDVRQNLITYLDSMGLVTETGVLVIPSTRHYFYDEEDMKGIRTVITLKPLNHIREMKDFLKQMISLLPLKSDFIGCFVDNRTQNGYSDKDGNGSKHEPDKDEVFENGIESRIPFINRMYSFIDSKTNRYLTKRSVANLLEEVGLELVSMSEMKGMTYFHSRKNIPA